MNPSSRLPTPPPAIPAVSIARRMPQPTLSELDEKLHAYAIPIFMSLGALLLFSLQTALALSGIFLFSAYLERSSRLPAASNPSSDLEPGQGPLSHPTSLASSAPLPPPEHHRSLSAPPSVSSASGQSGATASSSSPISRQNTLSTVLLGRDREALLRLPTPDAPTLSRSTTNSLTAIVPASPSSTNLKPTAPPAGGTAFHIDPAHPTVIEVVSGGNPGV